ncbi:MAG: phosphatidate cytidylyltransferase [Oscillospiraceae bacterium]|nr:phosphatidate cytidylyltransferase [Oscillospiraceae bacterium]
MLKRTIVGLVLAPVLLVVVLVMPKIVTALVVGIFCSISVYELLDSTKLVRNARMLLYTTVAAFFVALWSYCGCPDVLGLLGIVAFYALLFSEIMLADMKIPFSRLAMCMTGGLLIPFLLSSIVRILNMDEGRYYIMIPFVVAFLDDIGAYFIGSFFGKHKLCPNMSPNKTVEGFFGGLTSAVIGMLIYCLILQIGFGFEINYLLAVVYGLIGALAGVFGDLTFSVIKRQTGIKDYGNIFPGHGGILDRFDSVVIVAPLIEVLLLLIPVGQL